MPTMHRVLFFIAGCILGGCAIQTGVNDLQAVYGPGGILFDQQTFNIDLNDDGCPERLVLLIDKRREASLPTKDTFLSSGAIVDAFAIFDGRRPNVPIFYQYPEYDGYQLRLDNVDGQHVLVSDGGRDHIQNIWGWWKYPDDWPIAGWEARSRALNADQLTWGPWYLTSLVSVNVGK